MRRFAFAGLAALLLATCVGGQVVRRAQRGPTARQRPRPLRGEAKLRYLVKQLDLSPKDREYVQGLLEVYRVAVANQQAEQQQRGGLLERVRALYSEMQEAEKAGDQQRAEQLREQMKALGPGVVAEREFFDSLEAILSAEQKAALRRALARLERVPDGALRPIDLLDVARAQDLSRAQQRSLAKVLEDFRAYMRQKPGRLSEADRAAALERLSAAIRGLLTPEQAQRFDQQVEKLRPPAGGGARSERKPGGPDSR